MKLVKNLSGRGFLYLIFIMCNMVYGFDTVTLTFPYGDAVLDAAGYADVIDWGVSPYHPHGYHELLSGEWGAAIYYDGISTAPNAMWLTDEFKSPYWDTYCDFTLISYNALDNPANPVVGIDTAQSVIGNSQVRITIDYEIADLGENKFSPVAYRDVNGVVRIKASERYVLLQTYTIKNIKASGNITGLQLYQLLHAHPANAFAAIVHCSYATPEFPDALENYTPYNPVHQVGNFRYDITQWNDLMIPDADHFDWVGFSCATAPSVYECNYYPSDLWKETWGAHIDVENRNLDASNYSYGRSAGAMGWNLPTLAPGQST